MSNKAVLKKKQKRWVEIYEDRLLRNVIQKTPTRKKEDQNTNFILESRFQLMADSLEKTKYGSREFDLLLNECVDLFMEMNPDAKHCERESILKMTKDRIFQKEIIGEIDGKKVPKQDNDDSWPKSGFIPLREAIKRKDVGLNPKAKESENVKNVFGGDPKNNYPSPSSTNDDSKND